MKLRSNEDLYHFQLKDLVSMEKQIEAALPKLAEAVSSEQVRQAMAEHAEQTSEQRRKIEELVTSAGKSVRGRKCKGIAGILAEGEEAASSTGDDTTKDLAIIAAARRVEHYEIAAYRAAMGTAHAADRQEDVAALRLVLEQELSADRKLAVFAKQFTHLADAGDGDDGSPDQVPRHLTRSNDMPRYDDRYDDRDQDRNYGGYDGRSRGGQRSSHMQDRDEYGRFTGSGGGYDDDRGYGSGAGSRGGYEGRSRGGQHSSDMQDRDEYGRFTGYRGSSGGGRYDDDDRGGYSGRGGDYSGRSGRYEDDDRGYGGGRGGDITDSAGRHYSRDSWEAAQEGRARGGRHSHSNQYTGGGQYSGGRGYDDDDRGGNYGRGGGGNSGSGRGGNSGGRGRGDYDDDRGYITDSAGRRYTRESWEAAQEGRSRGGQHSHGGGGQYQGGRGGGY